MHELTKFIPLMPLVGFLLLGLFGKKIKNEKIIGLIGSATVFISFVLSVLIFFSMLGGNSEKPYIIDVYNWISAGTFSINISYQADHLSILFSLIITGVGFLIHVYSIGYMHGDRSFYRFFSYLNLFIFMMLNLVLASNYLLTFLGWEGVGLASYLLIGFWYDRKFDGVRITWTGDAGMKAFIVNRIGDFGFIIAMFLIYVTFGSLNYQDVMQSASVNSSQFMNTGIITAITLTMFLGCTGKSAQLPLAIWLPDAMAGPTSVSALIHAATMVTAGVFLVARNSVLFSLSQTTMTTVMVVGALTAITAASVGLVQNDIKKVLAYSTVSQLGFMFAALGIGAFSAGIFHVITHAFFKGLLFLAAGSVIHGMQGEQNIKKMGGLKKYMPITYKTFFAGTLAISGIPLFAGFFSKDEILAGAFEHNWIVWLVLVIAAIFTAFYMFRLLYLTFGGAERFDHHHVHPHESPKTITFALITLAILSTVGGFIGVPYALGFMFGKSPNLLHNWLEPVFADSWRILGQVETHEIHSSEYLLMLLAAGLAISMWYVAKNWYNNSRNSEFGNPKAIAASAPGVYKLLLNKYRLDEFYFFTVVDPIVRGSRSILWKFFDVSIIDGIVNGTARVIMSAGNSFRKIQTGIVQNYAMLMTFGIIIVISLIFFGIFN